MSQDRKKRGNVPNLRFPGFTGKWNEMKLGEIGEVKMCRRIFNNETSPIGEIPFFKIGSFGKEADAFVSKELYLEYRKKFSFPKKGDILISAAGTIGRTVVYKGDDAYFQDSNIVWIDNDNTNISNEFLYYILQIVKYNTEGGTIQRLYNNILKSTKFSAPTISEQKKISDFLSLIDQRIEAQNKIIEELNVLKATIAKKIFSQELRFKEFTNEWSSESLGRVCDFHKGSPLSKNDIVKNGSLKCIHYGELFTIYKAVITDVVSRTNNDGFKSNFGDILMPSSDVTPLGLATASAILKDDVVLGGDINILRPKVNINSIFLSYILNSDKKKIIKLVTGTTVKHIYNKDLQQLKFYFPSLEEQIKTANFLLSIDEKLEIEKQLLKQLENQKKYLLLNLFV
jgi:restriction endonuclease S subunit